MAGPDEQAAGHAGQYDPDPSGLRLGGWPSRVLYVGTDIGVFRATLDGNWQPFGTGLPPVVVTRLAYNAMTQQLLAATYGRGIWAIWTLLLAMTRRLVLGCLVALATACGGSIMLPAPTPITITGDWSGTWQFVTSGVTVTDNIRATFAQGRHGHRHVERRQRSDRSVHLRGRRQRHRHAHDHAGSWSAASRAPRPPA